MSQKELDIIIPCYNPLKDWHKSIVKSYNLISKELIDTNISIILVNDGSSFGVQDSDISILEKEIPSFTYINLPVNKGKGFALRKGFEKSTADFTIFTDIDFPYKEENLIAMYTQLQNGADLTIGIRNETYYEKVPVFRKFISNSFKKLLKFLFRIPTSDTQAGLKGFSLKGKKYLLDTTTNRYLFDLELIKRAAKDESIKSSYTTLSLKDNIVLSKLPLKILIGELGNLIKIFFL